MLLLRLKKVGNLCCERQNFGTMYFEPRSQLFDCCPMKGGHKDVEHNLSMRIIIVQEIARPGDVLLQPFQQFHASFFGTYFKRHCLDVVSLYPSSTLTPILMLALSTALRWWGHRTKGYRSLCPWLIAMHLQTFMIFATGAILQHCFIACLISRYRRLTMVAPGRACPRLQLIHFHRSCSGEEIQLASELRSLLEQ